MPAIDADRYWPIDGHAAYDAGLVAVIINGLVLRRAIVQIAVTVSVVTLCLFSGLFISFGAGLIWLKN